MITRVNYEEFFLLYADNELSAADRQVVETFVAENPDLEEELRTLLQCRLKSESNLFFKNKESLLKQELQPEQAENADQAKKEIFIDHTNYSAYFLSYADGELDEDSIMSVEDSIRRDPFLRRELALLQLMVNEPDPTIVFKNKEILYRKERDRKIMFFERNPVGFGIAAAAVVLLAIGLLTFNRMRKNTGPSLVVSSVSRARADEPAANPLVRKDTGSASIGGEDTDSAGTGSGNGGDTHTSRKKEDTVVTPASPGALYSPENGHQRQTAKTNRTAKQSVNYPERRRGKEEVSAGKMPALTDPLANRRSANPANSRTAQLVTKDGPDATQITAIDPKLTERSGSNALLQTGLAATGNPTPSSATIDPGGDGLAMELTSPKKNKLRGVFRRVSRVFEKTANLNDSEDKHGVLIGNLQIALK